MQLLDRSCQTIHKAAHAFFSCQGASPFDARDLSATRHKGALDAPLCLHEIPQEHSSGALAKPQGQSDASGCLPFRIDSGVSSPLYGRSVMSTTIKDVADLASVSTATVSRVVNGTGNVSGETRTRVLTAILSLQYHPNAHAAELGRARGRGLAESCAQVGKRAKLLHYPRGRRHHEETPRIETVGGKLRVWRVQGTNEIVIEPSVFAPTKKRGGLIYLSARHARHLANSLLLFAEETESSPTFTAARSSIRVARDAKGDQSP